jgi:hypothetical protein
MLGMWGKVSGTACRKRRSRRVAAQADGDIPLPGGSQRARGDSNRDARRAQFKKVSEETRTPVFGGSGAPTGMLVIVGRGMSWALLKLESN